MFPRISRLGARLLRESRAETRAGWLSVSLSVGDRCYFYLAGNLLSSQRIFYQDHVNRHSIPVMTPPVLSMRNALLSTATSGDQDESSQAKDKISVTFVNKDGSEKTICVPVGMSMLEAAHENDIELEGTNIKEMCTSLLLWLLPLWFYSQFMLGDKNDVNYYNKLEDPADEENDMLDLAFGLTETSRLGCQVIAKPELDGMRLALPVATRNFAVDGYVPKPH
ncbi:Adrenodoxin-like protein 2, mitochondrial [Zea mays]|uniref:Adrenodoxin-like protein 2, mitochondrial n=1 Tax=Zea mays TaxID=4577 RepID=A0A3L6DIA7_MAIZE|nr:Adrenodoxin-like protein 2, mitochondrial [Zea mays]